MRIMLVFSSKHLLYIINSNHWLVNYIMHVTLDKRIDTFFCHSFLLYITLFILYYYYVFQWLRVLVFNASFNNISVISRRSVLLVEETGVPGENHWSTPSHWQTLSHNVVSSTSCHERNSNSQRFSGDRHWLRW